MTKTITATELKTKTSEILDDVVFRQVVTLIERNGRVIAKLGPAESEEERVKKINEAWDKTFGSIPDFPDIKRYKSKRPIPSFD